MNNIQKEVFINAPPEVVWRHLEDPELLAGWLMRNNLRTEKGAEFQFQQQPSGNWDGTIHSRLVEFEPPRRMAFTWNANSICADTLVTIELEAKNGGALVRLMHTNWDGAVGDLDRHYRSHSAGWEDHLTVLEKQVEEEVHARPSPAIDWTRFSLFVAIDSPPDRVFDAWTTSTGMESFFVDMMAFYNRDGSLLEASERAQPGCRYVWRWDSGALARGEYLDVNPDEQVVFTFGDCKVAVYLQPRRDGTLLELCQYDMADTEQNRMHLHTNCRAAWVYFLTVLKTSLEHGVDGRDRSRETGGSFSTYFDPVAAGVIENRSTPPLRSQS
jgi:uncharacterized protein YndB with AHSA1/START domain